MSTNIEIIDALLIQFCRRVEHLYGKAAITPNMHMHCHLHENLSDYGPVYAFWLFSFERYNGVLGNQPTNTRNIESQLLEHFIEDNVVLTTELPSQFSSDILEHIQHLHSHLDTATISAHQSTDSNPQWSIEFGDVHLPQRGVCSLLSDALKDQLRDLYHKFYPSDAVNDVDIVSSFLKYSFVTVNSITYSSLASSKKNCIVMINWNTVLFGPPKQYDNILDPASFLHRPVLVHYYIKHSLTVNGEAHWHMFAVVSWLMPHPKHLACGKPVTIWCKDFFDSISGVAPIQLLSTLCVHSEDTLDGEQVLFVTPLIN